MNQSAFVGSQAVQSFTKWIATRLDQPGSFNHSYILMKNPKGKIWACTSLFDAFGNYNWHFSCTHPISKNYLQGDSFEDSRALLDSLSKGLRESIQQGDVELCQEYCIAILRWGGASEHNIREVLESGSAIIDRLKEAAFKLNPAMFSTVNDYIGIRMNSGFSKIYSLMIDDFIIYDSRVGAALGLLIRRYCEETKQSRVPTELAFAYSDGRGGMGSQGRRNPSSGIYNFPPLRNSHRLHIDSNLRANWLLKHVLENSESRFKEVDDKARLRALEAALFMIGYSVL